MRDNALLENISKLNTFIHMTKSNEFLGIYISKIMNNKSKSIKFINDFDYISLDLLYTSLQIMDSRQKITKEEVNKLDKKELKYYLDKTRGINFFKKQVNTIKDEETLISYIKQALSTGSYVCNNNSTVKFDNGLVVDSDWIVDFSHFLITSFNDNVNLSPDRFEYYFNTVSFPEEKHDSVKEYIKDLKQYEYCVHRKDEKRLSYDNVKYLINTLSTIEEYDFKKLQDMNSKLAKEGYTLSINKKNPSFNKDQKSKIEKFLNEDGYEEVLKEYINNELKCYNSSTNINKRRLINNYELLLDLSRAYKSNYSLVECRKLFDLKEHKNEINNALALANFYINYIYDEANLYKYFNYATLKLEDMKPSIIDYETAEYKEIIKSLSELNKKTILINRKINKHINNANRLPKNNKKLIEENSLALGRYCHELERTVKEIKELREELQYAKDDSRRISNMNKTKLKYIKEAISNGMYEYDPDTTQLVFDYYNPKDYHHAFHLEMSLDNFIEIILSDYNRNLRINFYQI